MQIRLLFPILLSVAAAPAQAPLAVAIDQGPLAGTHAALSLFRDPSTAQDQVLYKKAGFNTTPPPGFNPGLPLPDFRSSAVFGSRGGTCATPSGVLNIDAISIGADLIQTDSTGVLSPLFLGNYYGMLFSVTAATPGVTGFMIGDEVARGGVFGAAGDIFSYTLMGPPQYLPAIPDAERAVDSPEILLPGGAPATAEIDGLDWYIPLYDVPQLLSVLMPDPVLYFSVDSATAGNIPLAWCGGNPAFQSGATIFRTQWNPATLRWSCPVIALEPGQLGLGTGEDVDALAVDTVLHQPETYIVFSTTTPSRDPLLFAETAQMRILPMNFVFSVAVGVPVSSLLYLGGGDIDAISLVDPGRTGNVGRPSCGGSGFWSQGFSCWQGAIAGQGRASSLWASPLPVLPIANTVATSWHRRGAAGGEVMSFTAGLNPGLAYLLLEVPAGSFTLFSVGWVPRDQNFAGSPAVWTVPVPPGLTGLSIGLWWVDFATSPTMPPPNVLRL